MSILPVQKRKESATDFSAADSFVNRCLLLHTDSDHRKLLPVQRNVREIDLFDNGYRIAFYDFSRCDDTAEKPFLWQQ